MQCPLHGTLNPNTLMQLDVFCKQLSKWAEISYIQALLTECIVPYYAFLIFSFHASLSRLPHQAKFLPSQCIWGRDADVVVVSYYYCSVLLGSLPCQRQAQDGYTNMTLRWSEARVPP